jgi:NADH:ubiquinone oxidoreductase subunit B-like Fe-S oxidoreductase/NADH:ubiquinone oxidoreductase subunit C
VVEEMIRGFIEKLIRWARAKSLWMVHHCAACGAIEFPPLIMTPVDWERYGYLPMPTPRQSDFYAGMGYLTKKSVKLFLNIYRQIPRPRYVVAGCNCTATGGLYWDSYATYKRLDDFAEVYGWVPGCMPMPDDYTALITDLYYNLVKKSIDHKGCLIKEDAFKKIKEWEELERKWAEEYYEAMKKAEVVAVNDFEEKFGECVEEYKELKICVTTVKPERIRDAVKTMVDKGYILLNNINTVDEPKKGIIEIYYILENPENGEQIWIKTIVPRNNPVIDSIHDILPLAEYIEREVYEMMGIIFKGHPRLEKWILDGNWEGPPPLRKDVDTASFVVKVQYNGYKYGR